MSFLFIGNEDIDFQFVHPSIQFSTDSSLFRSSYVRCCTVFPTGGSEDTRIKTAFSSAANEFWYSFRFTSQFSFREEFVVNRFFLRFYDGNTLRLALRGNGGSNQKLTKYNDAGVATDLTGSINLANTGGTGARYDIYIKYGVAGVFAIYQNGFLLYTYNGDLTSGSSTTLDSCVMCPPKNQPDYACWASEFIASTEDTRTMNIVSLTPQANGVTTEWTGTVAAINELNLDTASYIYTSNTAEKVQTYQVSDLPVISSNNQIRAVKVAASMARGTYGPVNAQLGVRAGDDANTNFGTAFSSNIAVDTGFTTLQTIFDTNPVNSQNWTPNMVNAMQIAIKSKP